MKRLLQRSPMYFTSVSLRVFFSGTSIVCFLTLLLGILIGLSLSTIGKETSKISSVSGIQKEYYKELTKKVDDIEEITALQRGDLFQKEKDQNQYESDNTVSRNLYKKVRLLCWILTAGVNHGKKAAHVKATWGQRCNIILFVSGKKGYILSKEALRRFATISLNNKTICKIKGTEGIEEDVMMAKCLNNVGVKLMDSRDEKGRERFLPFQPSDHLVPGKISLDHWYWNNVYYKAKKGEGCCSDTLISLHHLRPEDMYVFDYLLYRVRIHGIYPPRFPEGWTAPPPPDEDGKELPWIGIKEETKKKSNV
ncbi:glycoprotein-N-acetylgalactosamine 3-beta-galactosyltransferase 1-like isoform X4 [Artemia franciscana]|uniref:glycoprotein-N-acetylgalactosamine 3-beta-galactosyltransferase 1-like isoform X4 n=1 Tax=Artemia franciscana TaxID=6661 RepID=UPI0032DBCD1A